MRRLVVDNYNGLPWEIDISFLNSDDIELTDDWVIIKRKEYNKLKDFYNSSDSHIKDQCF